MRYSMENASMKVEVESLGAELKSVLGKKSNIEYMWCSNPEYYKRSAPNLFPIVGSLKDGVYHYQEKTYEMELIYHMNGNRLEITWNIKNTGKEKCVFPGSSVIWTLVSREEECTICSH